jgi:hypothetical protein
MDAEEFIELSGREFERRLHDEAAQIGRAHV